MRTVVVVQARTGSSRLPGKVLLPLAGRPLLERLLDRVRAASTPDDVVVATTRDASDNVVHDLALAAGVPCYRGDVHDLLDRHVQAARFARADAIVKIPSDCPLIDPTVIDRVIECFRANASTCDYVSNLHPATFPDGQDVEVMPTSVLEIAWREAREHYEREHTTPYIWERPQRFRLVNVEMTGGTDYSRSHRWTIDYPEDYDLIAAIYDALWMPGRVFSLEDIVELLSARPELASINAKYRGRGWYADHLQHRAAGGRAGVTP